ncbi:helix-turn-helix domain-containing protein [Desulfosarcina cetonica]|uniref:helix-turn-helix domain-containing protein n=1 Tax=Desulfosarcina cetonica TaxID=90730 RepID=UPI003BEEBC17
MRISIYWWSISAIESLEKKMIAEALDQTRGHRGATAKLLKIPRRSLQRKIKKYQIETQD